jgi:hypothetical protein
VSRSPRAHRCLRTLLALVLGCGVAVARGDDEGPRRVLSGTIDSRAGLWEQGSRLPLPGVIISSETYLLLTPSLTAADDARLLTVHRAQLTGEPSAAQRAALFRIALSGVISSYERELAGPAVVDAPRDEVTPILEPTPGGGFVLAAPVTTGTAPSGATRGSSARERDAALLRRYALAGVISSDDDRIVRVPRDDLDPRPRPARGRALDHAEAVLARLVDDLTRPSLRTYLRADGAEFDDGRTESTVLASAQARFTAAYRRPLWSATLAYNLDAAEYLQGDLDRFVNHSLTTGFDFRLGRAKTLAVTYRRRSWRDHREAQAIDDFQATVSGPYTQAIENLGVRWHHKPNRGRFGHTLALSRDRTVVRFAGDDGFEQATNSASGSVLYRLNRRVTLLVDGQYQSLAYAERSDSSQLRLRGGAEMRISRRLTGGGAIGLEHKRFEDGTPRDEVLDLAADLDWQAGRRDAISLDLSRGFAEVFDRGPADLAPNAYTVRSAAIVGWEHQWTSRWSTQSSVGYRHQDPRNSNARSEDWQLQASGRYALSRDLRVSAAAAYTRSRDAVRGDFERWTVTLSLDLPGRRQARGRRGS